MNFTNSELSTREQVRIGHRVGPAGKSRLEAPSRKHVRSICETSSLCNKCWIELRIGQLNKNKLKLSPHVRRDAHTMNRGQDFREHDRDGGESGSSRSSTPVPSPRRNRVRATGGGARAHSTLSLLDSMERRTQRTYRYGIGLVCIGATLNWLGFAQVKAYILFHVHVRGFVKRLLKSGNLANGEWRCRASTQLKCNYHTHTRPDDGRIHFAFATR